MQGVTLQILEAMYINGWILIKLLILLLNVQKNYLKKEAYLLQTNSKASGGILMNQKFYDGIKDILLTARNKVYKTANFAWLKPIGI